MEVGPKNSNVQKMATICEQNRYNREETKPKGDRAFTKVAVVPRKKGHK